jgi:hypothetical protein
MTDAASPGPTRADLGIAVLLAAGAVLIQWPFRLLTVNLIDEGLIVQVADDLLHGRRLYADAAVYAWPAVYLLTAGAFAIFGATVETARSLAVVVFALVPATGYLIARWYAPRRAAVAVALALLGYRVWAYPHWQFPSYSSLASVLGLVAVWCTGQALAREGLVRFAVAGAVGGLAMLAKQDAGASMTAALGLAVLLAPPTTRSSRWVRAATFAAGAVIVVGTVIGAFVAVGLGGDLLRESVLGPLYGATTFDYPGRPPLWPLGGPQPAFRAKAFTYLPSVLVDVHWSELIASRLWRDTGVIDAAVTLVYHLPWLLLLVSVPAALRELRPGGRPGRPLLVLWCANLGALLAFSRPHDWVHLLVLYPPTLLLLAALLARSAARGGALGTVARVVGWGGAGALVASAAWLTAGLVRVHDTPVRTARGTLWAQATQAVPLQGLLDALAAAPEGPLLAFPYHSMLNFMSGRRGVTRHYVIWPVERNADRDGEVLRDLAAHPDAQVVYSQMQVPHYPRPAQYTPSIWSRLVEDWDVVSLFGGDPGGFTMYLLARGRPDGSPLIDPLLSDATVWISPREGAPYVANAALDARLVRHEQWPFRETVAVSTLADASTTLAYPLVPGPDERLRVWYALNLERLGGVFQPGARVRVRIDDGGDEHVVLDRVLAQTRPADRGWHALEVDLRPWAHRRVTLALEARATDGVAWDALVGWGDPRIVTP